MLTRNAMRMMICAVVLVATAGTAKSQDVISKRVNDAVVQAKATDDPVEKRAILSRGLGDMVQVLGKVRGAPLLSERDAANIDDLQSSLTEKCDELAGRNGFDPVPDAQLNAFADYIVQDMEQAQTITISVVTLLLIIIIIILLA